MASAAVCGFDATRALVSGIAGVATAAAGASVPRVAHGMDAFLDPKRFLPKARKKEATVVGREWLAHELRLKGFADLHALWHVLLTEKNMLQTEKYLARANQKTFRAAHRIGMVRRSMSRIKFILSERAQEDAGEDMKMRLRFMDIINRK
eukprot:CAMPEP_0197593136 /NCGR_PEP_ID=MMETSP1326-20131121/17271_1 /TAXON_ID=1155430 /ORGANISM="Genus nov. species nov., Strain RCC2288" /LENGTH=149 /DNA_ID=CAMNT_0043159023 /DNA_START=318 /DNA_END=767 /DNA_ORIENTATION=+